MEEWENSQIKVTGVAHPPISWCKLQFLVSLSLGRKAKIFSSLQVPLVAVCEEYTAISRKVVGKTVHATIPKGNMGYDQYTFPDTVAVEPTFIAFL